MHVSLLVAIHISTAGPEEVLCATFNGGAIRAGFRGHGAQGPRPPTKTGPPITKPFNFYFHYKIYT